MRWSIRGSCRATVLGTTHSIVGSSAWEPAPWGAVQRAAWEVLNKQAQ
jgi:hypothetical protein